MATRLAAATSPYLRQHAENPVDWWPWCDEAFDEARRRRVPVMLSVGYAACHWCHVMAHESFEDAATAALLNERFVSIKVDREERPDIDAVYMAATQAMTGRGGWPMTVFLDHDGHAFYAGTYFPPRSQPGLPSFTSVLTAVEEAWREQPDRVASAAAQLHETLARQSAWALAGHAPTYSDVVEAVARLAGEFDPRRGGFGTAPKFPATPVLEFLLRAHALAEAAARHTPFQAVAELEDDASGAEPAIPAQMDRSGLVEAADAATPASATPDPMAHPTDPNAHPTATLALTMATRTLSAMARGGIYDQLSGGFARYSVDADWVVPHFEKMLSDNAQLLRVYLHWWRATGDPLARRVAEETADFLLAELGTAEGGFASSLDADSDGREGAFAVWTPTQLDSVLGPTDGAWVARLCAVTEPGTFEGGASVLQLPADPDDAVRWRRCREALAAARERRPRPGRDDKVVAAWNGLAIAALAESGILLERSDLVAAAVACAEHLHAVHWSPDRHRLARVSLAGRVNPDASGVLEDYADLAEGLLALYQVTGDDRWYQWAGELLDVVLEQFRDGEGFFDTAADAPALVRRPQDPTDGVAPSGWSASANALVTAAALGAGDRFRTAAHHALSALLPLAERNPRFTGWAWTAISALVAGPVQVAVVMPGDADVPPSDPGTRPDHPALPPGSETARPGSSTLATQLQRAALRSTSPGLVVAVGRQGSGDVPLLRGRAALDGRPTAYPCRGFVCDLPVATVAALEEAIAR